MSERTLVLYLTVIRGASMKAVKKFPYENKAEILNRDGFIKKFLKIYGDSHTADWPIQGCTYDVVSRAIDDLSEAFPKAPFAQYNVFNPEFDIKYVRDAVVCIDQGSYQHYE